MKTAKFVSAILLCSFASSISASALDQGPLNENDKRHIASASKKLAANAKATEENTEEQDAKALKVLEGLSPSDAYMKFREKMIEAKSINDLRPYFSKETKEETMSSKEDPEQEQKLFELMQMMVPPKVKVVKETIDGNVATLNLVALEKSKMDEDMDQLATSMAEGIAGAMGQKIPKGEKPPESSTTGVVTMKKEDGVWKQHKEKWKSKMGNPDAADSKEKSSASESTSESETPKATEKVQSSEKSDCCK